MYSDADTLAGGLPHSDVHGSKPARGSPWLFAACHVLHRLLVPRHPPNALLALEIARTSPSGDAQARHAQEPSTRTQAVTQHTQTPLTAHPMPPGNPLAEINRSDKGGIGRGMAHATPHASRDAPEPDSHLQRTTQRRHPFGTMSQQRRHPTDPIMPQHERPRSLCLP